MRPFRWILRVDKEGKWNSGRDRQKEKEEWNNGRDTVKKSEREKKEKNIYGDAVSYSLEFVTSADIHTLF